MEFSRFFVLFFVYFTSYINAEVEPPVALPLRGDVNLAHKDQFKYLVALLRNGVHFCGGGIIADHFVLTAAHCVINKNDRNFRESQLTAVAGVLDSEHEKGVEAKVEAIYVPKSYDYANASVDDIAVLKLKSGLGLNQNEYLKRPSIVRWAYPTYANVTAIVAGYGFNNVIVRYNDDGELVQIAPKQDAILRFAEADIMDNTKCNYLHRGGITRNNLCAKMHQTRSGGARGICNGDSGGPLVVHSNIVVGLVSTGKTGCSERIRPGIYTRVSSFVPFINNVLNGRRTSDMRVATWEEPYFSSIFASKFVEN